MMHILMVTGEYPPLTGGVGDYTRLLARALIREGHRVRIAAATGTPAAGRGGADEPEVLTLPRRWARGHKMAIARLARAEPNSWIHVQYQTAAYRMNPEVNRSPAAWSARGLRVAWTYHDLLPPYLFPLAGNTLRQRVTLAPGRASRMVVTTNREDADRLAQAGIRAEVSPVGSNIPIAPLKPRERADLRDSWQARPGEPVIGCFGLAGRTKGLQTLVEATRLLKKGTDLRIVIIGGTPGASDRSNAAFLQSLQGAIRSAGLEDRVHWTGALSDQEVSRALSACDLMVQPYTEGASTRHGSLMACLDHGCATITSTPLSEQLAGPGGTDRAAPGTSWPWQSRIACLAASPEKRAAAAAAARTSAADRSWERIADQHAALYAAAA